MGGGIRNLGLGLGVLGYALTAMPLLSSTARADDCPQVQLAPSCKNYQRQLAPKSCLRASVVFVQVTSGWSVVDGTSNVTRPNSKVLHFFYVIGPVVAPNGATVAETDLNNSKQQVGVAFVGITRDNPPVTPDTVRLSQNKGSEFNTSKPKPSDDLTDYNSAITGMTPPRNVLKVWGTVKPAAPIFDMNDSSVWKNFALVPGKSNPPDMHARLYKFDYGSGLMCIPFSVGLPNIISDIRGSAFDVFTGAHTPDEFEVQIDSKTLN